MSRSAKTTRRALPLPIRALLHGGLLALALGVFGAGAAHANRFGPPWLAQVTVDQTTVYSQPDRASPPVGPLGRGATLIVLGEPKGTDGTDWTETNLGFVLSSDVDEVRNSWIAEVAVPSVSIYAKPNAQSPIRRTGKAGDLLRITGLSPGLDGDTANWWATTEGYVALDAIRGATTEWAGSWNLPSLAEAPNGWWGTLRSEANARAAPTMDAPVVGTLAAGDRVKVLAEEQGQPIGGDPTWYRIDGGRYAGAKIHSSLVSHLPDPAPNTTPPPPDAPPGPWIVVDRATTSLTFVKDGKPQFVTYVSLGRAGVDTPTGQYSTFGKYKADDMTSTSVANADHTYDLPNVPFTQYYREGGYAIHGTYWHDHFGLVESQGCVNLTWTDAGYLFSLTRPWVADEDNARWSPAEQATPVLIVN